MRRKKRLFRALLLAALTIVAACGSSGHGSISVAPTYSISGTITASSAGLPEVAVSLSSESTTTVTTDASGNYTFTDLVNGNYMITPNKAGYTFTPPNRPVTVENADVSGQNFMAF